MDDLAKIYNVLKLKRTRLEHDVAGINAAIRVLEDKTKALRQGKQDMTDAVFSGQVSDNVAGDIITLGKWTAAVDAKINSIATQRAERETDLSAVKQTLKEIIVKQDIIKQKLDKAQTTAFNDWQDAEAETRLEGWVTANY